MILCAFERGSFENGPINFYVALCPSVISHTSKTVERILMKFGISKVQIWFIATFQFLLKSKKIYKRQLVSRLRWALTRSRCVNLSTVRSRAETYAKLIPWRPWLCISFAAAQERCFAAHRLKLFHRFIFVSVCTLTFLFQHPRSVFFVRVDNYSITYWYRWVKARNILPRATDFKRLKFYNGDDETAILRRLVCFQRSYVVLCAWRDHNNGVNRNISRQDME